MINDKLKEYLERNEQYILLREITGRGVCGIKRFIFTTAIVYDLDEIGYKGRYCFNTMSEAIKNFMIWDGVEDPDGDWLRHKGLEEYVNPKLIDKKNK